jgi:hypothetical protein
MIEGEFYSQVQKDNSSHSVKKVTWKLQAQDFHAIDLLSGSLLNHTGY